MLEDSLEQHFTPDVADEQSRFGHVRAEPRESMFLVAVLRRLGGPDISVKVRNLSPGGMMAECPVSFSRGEAIEVELRGIGLVAGTIAWTAGGRAGVAFATPVDPRLARKPLGVNAPQPDLVSVSPRMWCPPLR